MKRNEITRQQSFAIKASFADDVKRLRLRGKSDADIAVITGRKLSQVKEVE